MPLNLVSTFIGVAIWENEVDEEGNELTLENLADRLGITHAAIRYHTRYLGKRYRRGVKGLGLVRTFEYAENRRKKAFVLAPRGRQLIRQLAEILSKSGR